MSSSREVAEQHVLSSFPSLLRMILPPGWRLDEIRLNGHRDGYYCLLVEMKEDGAHADGVAGDPAEALVKAARYARAINDRY